MTFADPKPVAAIVTEYRQNSHADLIVGRILEGYDFDSKSKPNLRLVSLYTDQVPANDWSRPLAKKHGVAVFDKIDGAVTLGTDSVAVEGVLCIGEHGNYPLDEQGRQLYPRRRFFEQVTAAFEKCQKSVPVFNDKHLASTWSDAKWMVDRSRELKIPFMAGSTLPLTWRRPALRIPMNCQITEALAVGYGDTESSGFHALEMLECMVERRLGGECGVHRVHYLEGREVWKADYSPRLLSEALECCPGAKRGSPRLNCGDNATAFVIDYCDGLRATVLMLNGHVREFGFAARTRGIGIRKVVACQFYLQPDRPFSHFTHLVQAIEGLVQTGHAPYPIERNLLTTGILDAVMTSRHKRQPVHTPHLAISYEPVDCSFATDPIPG